MRNGYLRKSKKLASNKVNAKLPMLQAYDVENVSEDVLVLYG